MNYRNYFQIQEWLYREDVQSYTFISQQKQKITKTSFHFPYFIDPNI